MNIKFLIYIILIIMNIFEIQANTINSDASTEHHIINKEPILVFDNSTNNTIINSRTRKPLPTKRYRNGAKLTPKLLASASAQPNLLDFKYIFAQAKKINPKIDPSKIFIIDLRQEPHAMIDGNAISWYGFKNQVAHSLENHLIQDLLSKSMVKIYTGLRKLPEGRVMPKKHILVKPENIATEQTVVQGLGANYLKLLVTDHFAPLDPQVDLFIDFVKTLPKDRWLHFHCRGGRGRSTTFMTMLDIIQYHNKLSLSDLIYRQKSIGGVILSKVKFNSKVKQWKEAGSKERYDFIKKFYEYVKDPKGYKSTSWSDWLEQQTT